MAKPDREKFVYHGTAHSLLPFIAKVGLDPEASQGATWFHKDPKESRRYAEEHPNQLLGAKRKGALLRVPVSKLPIDALQHLSYSDITATEKSVPPEHIEHEQPDGSWKSLADLDITKRDGGDVEGDGITAYHGSPHDFEQFDTSKIGTGEGAQVYGHGLYFAGHEPVAQEYRDNLSADQSEPIEVDGEKFHQPTRMQRLVANHFGDVDAVLKRMEPNWEHAISTHYSISDDADELERMIAEDKAIEAYKERAEVEGMRGKTVKYGKPGHMYEVHINAHPDHLLDWDIPISQQSDHVKYAIKNALDYAKKSATTPEQRFSWSSVFKRPDEFLDYTGSSIQNLLSRNLGLESASDVLAKHGIKGIKYLDSGSRSAGEGSSNYVVFDHNHVKVRRKYEHGGMVDEAA